MSENREKVAVFAVHWDSCCPPPTPGMKPPSPSLSRTELMARPRGSESEAGLRVRDAGVPRGPPLTAPPSDQTHGSLLRLHQVSPADSGEYVCRVGGGSVPLEASVLVTIEPASSMPGEWHSREGRAGDP